MDQSHGKDFDNIFFANTFSTFVTYDSISSQSETGAVNVKESSFPIYLYKRFAGGGSPSKKTN